MAIELLCPKCGSWLERSKILRWDGWYDCPKCRLLIGEPDWNDPDDEGVVLDPEVDLWSYSIPKRRKDKRGGNSKGRSRSKKPKREPVLTPLPLPPLGRKVIAGNVVANHDPLTN